VLVQGEVSALGVIGPGGGLSIEGDQVIVRDGGFITSRTFGDADAGQIAIDAGTLEVSGSLSGIAAFAAPTSVTGGTGNGGSIAVTAEQVTLRDGAQLTVSTQGDGNAGRIDVQADRLSIEGIDVNGNRSGIFSQVQAGVTGDGGAIDLTLAALAIRDGGQISATTTSDLGGLPGSVHITAQDVGIINSEDAIVAASESQFNDAGDIRIAAANRVELRDSSISAGATLTGGGNIDIQAGDAILLRRSVGDPSLSEKGAAILANLGPFSTRQGGNVRLAAPVVVLDSAGIVANAPAGLGGSVAMSSEAFFVPGGRLTEISPGLFVAAGDTFIDVSGGLTVGELQIRSPDAAVVTQIATLGQDFLDVTRLATDECAARERRVGSLVVRGRDRIPAPPGEELPTFYLDESGSAQ
jgi:large exoprotein involved in heme utilization and adhesion